MTTGLGISIGTVNVVSARVDAERPRPTVRIRRTAVGFDSAGTARLGGITRFPTAVNEFADLGRDPEPVFVDGRIWSPANIFASVVSGLLAGVEPEAGVVATYPAGYSDKQVMLLRQALELSGTGRVRLVPEPVAAAQWLEQENGPLDTGFILVYDLGGNSLDVTVVRTGPDCPDHPMAGKPLRSYDFGGRPLGAMIARCAGDRPLGAPAAKPGGLSLLSIVDTESLRRDQIRDSLELVRAAVRSAGIGMSDIGRVLLVGGAARPPQVASTLAELGLPVTVSTDPGQCTAVGAALLAARATTLAAGSRQQRAPIFSGAALFSAVAMSAATVLGGGTGDTDLPAAHGYPGPDAGALLYEIHGKAMVERTDSGGWSVQYGPRAGGSGAVAPVGHTRPSLGPSLAESGSAERTAPRRLHHRHETGPYSDPSRFANPLPFVYPAPHVLRPPAGPSHVSPVTEMPSHIDGPDGRPQGPRKPLPSPEQPASGPPALPGIGLPGNDSGVSTGDSTGSLPGPIGTPVVPGATYGGSPSVSTSLDAATGSGVETSSSTGVSGPAASSGTVTPGGTGTSFPGGPTGGISPHTGAPEGSLGTFPGAAAPGGRTSAGSPAGRRGASASSSSDHGSSGASARPGNSGKSGASHDSRGGATSGSRSR
ncbi:Hsp70 family protein [Nocardia brevicatena]|uniref:Hsp70 family protein n=1 Tax=Nocardia brevicatena TaxID=37327 RepID=UPI00031075C7|nr:Hsp70 family protein [Nocardia brevicatena]